MNQEVDSVTIIEEHHIGWPLNPVEVIQPFVRPASIRLEYSPQEGAGTRGEADKRWPVDEEREEIGPSDLRRAKYVNDLGDRTDPPATQPGSGAIETIVQDGDSRR